MEEEQQTKTEAEIEPDVNNTSKPEKEIKDSSEHDKPQISGPEKAAL